MASRVVPEISDTMTRSSPNIAFTNDDFPTFGRPINEKRTASSSSDASTSGKLATT